MHEPNEIECKDKLRGKLCGKLFQTKWDYQWHEINEHKPFTCPICGSKFKEENFLETHLKNDPSSRPQKAAFKKVQIQRYCHY